mmetsp:Transcript_2938/g.3446  ORF Transcript_2938/g.3446 Transcript_2938/m.3446 type:complete len:347 (-) Transcript_2938:176-1216(-)
MSTLYGTFWRRTQSRCNTIHATRQLAVFVNSFIPSEQAALLTNVTHFSSLLKRRKYSQIFFYSTIHATNSRSAHYHERYLEQNSNTVCHRGIYAHCGNSYSTIVSCRNAQHYHVPTFLQTTELTYKVIVARRNFSSLNNDNRSSIEAKKAAARSILGLPKSDSLTYKQLRQSYFEVAKQCHPDSALSKKKMDQDDNYDPSEQFLALTDAYELLKKIYTKNGTMLDNYDDDFELSREEEITYRQDCYHSLGTSAELIEEMKRDGMFLEWLKGKTDAAYAWRMFFMMHGGLVPKKLRFSVIDSGGLGISQNNTNGSGKKEVIRRRRPRERGVPLPGSPSGLSGVRGRQ